MRLGRRLWLGVCSKGVSSKVNSKTKAGSLLTAISLLYSKTCAVLV